MLTWLRHLVGNALVHQGFRRYFSNTSWMFAEQLLRIIAGLLVGIWMARYLGPEQFGIFSYALAVAAIFGSIAKLGLDGILVRDLVQEPKRKDVYLGTAFWLKVIGAFVTFGVLALAIPFTSNDHRTNLYIFIIASGLIFQAFEVIDFYFQSQALAKFVSICKVIQLALSTLIKTYLILAESGLIWFVLVTLFDQLTLALALFVAYRRRENLSFYKIFDLTTAQSFLKNSWPLIFSSLVIMVYMRIDQIMIREMLGEHQVGIYSAAVRLSEAGYFIPIIITTSLFPAIINAKRASVELYYARLQRLYTIMVWVSIGIAVPMTFFGEWVVILLYGQAYREASQVLMIHVWAGVFVFYGCARGKWLISENLQNYGFVCTSIGAITNVALNSVLIARMGINGAAIATLVSQGMASIVVPLFFSKDRISVRMFLRTFLFRRLKLK